MKERERGKEVLLLYTQRNSSSSREHDVGRSGCHVYKLGRDVRNSGLEQSTGKEAVTKHSGTMTRSSVNIM